MDSPLHPCVDPSCRGRNLTEEEKRALEKLKSLLNWLTHRNFDKIKDEIVLTIRRCPPSSSLLKSLVSFIFDMAVVDNAYALFSRLSIHLFHELPPLRNHGEVTSFERLFLRKCRMELENSSPKNDRPPLVYVDESSCWMFIKTVRVLAHVFQNSTVTETTRQSIIQLLMDPIFPPQRNIDAMNLFLSSIGKLADFNFSDESFKQQLQCSQRAEEFEKKYNGEVKLRKEAEDALYRTKEELEMMKRLLESYKEEQSRLRFQVKVLEQEYQDELRVRQETEDLLAIERGRLEKEKVRVETLKDELDSMRSKALEFERKYEAELILGKESEIALDKEKDKLEEMKQMLESCKIEQENLTSQVITWQEKYDQESSLRKETEDALSRGKQELEIVKGLLESYNREADAMREERNNALKRVEELERKQKEERQPPQSFICPITQEIMKEPHIAGDGFTYEAEAIKRWLKGHDTSPMTNLKLPHRDLVPNRALRSAIQELV